MRVPSRSSAIALLSLSLAVVVHAQDAVTLTPAANAASASDISQVVPPSFAGFGLEPSNLYSFTGGENSNELSVNLLENLAGYSGVPAHIRLGGNTQDNFVYDASMDEYRMKKNPNSQGQGAYASDLYLIGPKYWEAINRFPQDTPITFGLNLAYSASDYVDNIVKEAKAALEGLKNVKLVSFEIGNEPDLYLKNGFRTGAWSGQVYTQEWTDRANAIYEQVLKPAGLSSAFFEPSATASTIGTTFEISQLIEFGINDKASGANTGYVAGWNQHDYFYFVDVSTYTLTLDYLLDFNHTENQFAYWKQQVGIGLESGLPYFLREMASAGPTGLQGISDTFGASLWTFNFFLYAATLNISMVGIHMTDNSFAAPWQPIHMFDKDAHVRPSYYAFSAMAQLLGNGNGTTQISNLPLTGLSGDYTGNVRAYAAYAKGNLSGVVVINSKPVNASEGSKGSLKFTLSVPSLQGQTLYLSTLTADGADSASGTTWNGVSYESDNGKPKTVNSDVQTVKVGSDGTASITVRDSQAVVANAGSLLGVNAVLKPDGTPSRSTKKGSATATNGATNAAIAGVITTTIALAHATGAAAALGRARPDGIDESFIYGLAALGMGGAMLGFAW